MEIRIKQVQLSHLDIQQDNVEGFKEKYWNIILHNILLRNSTTMAAIAQLLVKILNYR